MTFVNILSAKRFEDLLQPGESKDDGFKRLAKLCHPDKFPGNKKAEDAFKHLNHLRGVNGSAAEILIGKWSISQPFTRGDIADLYITKDLAVFKIARSERDNDLMLQEKTVVNLIHSSKDEKFPLYVPRVIESFKASGRVTNVLEYADKYVSLEEIWQRCGPLDFRHIVWMMNRLFSALGFIHRLELVHGAIVPTHLLYNPTNHTMQLVDWCYSTKIGGKVPAIVKKYKTLYPKEILAKGQAQTSSDLFMAMGIVRRTAQNIPAKFRPLIEWAEAGSPASRPADAWAFQDRWRATAKEVYGDPKFVELTIPVN